MSKQTAVEWLALYIKGITSLNCDDIIEQAKEMEKEQIIKFAFEYMMQSKPAVDYYNETFKDE